MELAGVGNARQDRATARIRPTAAVQTALRGGGGADEAKPGSGDNAIGTAPGGRRSAVGSGLIGVVDLAVHGGALVGVLPVAQHIGALEGVGHVQGHRGGCPVPRLRTRLL